MLHMCPSWLYYAPCVLCVVYALSLLLLCPCVSSVVSVTCPYPLCLVYAPFAFVMPHLSCLTLLKCLDYQCSCLYICSSALNIYAFVLFKHVLSTSLHPCPNYAPVFTMSISNTTQHHAHLLQSVCSNLASKLHPDQPNIHEQFITLRNIQQSMFIKLERRDGIVCLWFSWWY